MRDPLLSTMSFGGGDTRILHVDPERVEKEEFEAAAVLTDIIWGPEGLAYYLGPTWSMVHDPRFMKIERTAVIEKSSMSGGKVHKGVSIIQALDLRSKIEIVDDLEIYSELIGEGRHFLEACRAREIDPHTLQDDETLIWELMRAECSNYQRRNGTWNDEAHRLVRMIKEGLVGLVADYCDTAFSQDWIRMDTQEIVPKGARVMARQDEIPVEEGVTLIEKLDLASVPVLDAEQDIPTVAVEIDSIQRCLTMRAQVRMTALRCLQQFPGIKKEDLEGVILTDAETDQICQILFSIEHQDKLYTVMPQVINLVKKAQAISFERRLADELALAQQTSQDFCAKLKSGEIEPIITLEGEDNGNHDEAHFALSLMGNEQKKLRFEAIQMFEADGDFEAAKIVQELLNTNGAEEVWTKVYEFLLTKHDEMSQHRAQLHIGNAINASEPINEGPSVPTITTVEHTLE
jgi:hypothetical protein